MSYNIFINSSIYNLGIKEYDKLKEVLNSVENPRWHTDDVADIVIDEDFDRRHIIAILKYIGYKVEELE